MRIKHHITRSIHHASNAPLWKKIVIITVVIAMPTFFMVVNLMQTDTAIEVTADNNISYQQNLQ